MILCKWASRFFYLEGITPSVAGFFVCIGFVLSVLMPLDVRAGWFGPDNYEDCILEKMKDQPRNMMSYAQDACEKKFPYEKELVPYNGLFPLEGNPGNYNGSDLDLSWCDNTSSSSVSICVSKNKTGYRITKAIMAFSTEDCKVSWRAEVFLTFTFSRWRNKSTADVKGYDRFKCMRQVKVYGEQAE